MRARYGGQYIAESISHIAAGRHRYATNASSDAPSRPARRAKSCIPKISERTERNEISPELWSPRPSLPAPAVSLVCPSAAWVCGQLIFEPNRLLMGRGNCGRCGRVVGECERFLIAAPGQFSPLSLLFALVRELFGIGGEAMPLNTTLAPKFGGYFVDISRADA